MFVHHIVTIVLLSGSYMYGYQRIGILVLVVHDASDIGVDLIKMFNYLKLEGTKGLFLSEIIYILNLCSWMYWRLYIFPSHVIYSSFYESHTLMASHSAGQLWRNFRPFELWSILLKYSYDQINTPTLDILLPSILPSLFAMNFFLLVLLLLHWYWFFLFVRIGYKILTKGAHEAGAEEYEGPSGSDRE